MRPFCAPARAAGSRCLEEQRAFSAPVLELNEAMVNFYAAARDRERRGGAHRLHTDAGTGRQRLLLNTDENTK